MTEQYKNPFENPGKISEINRWARIFHESNSPYFAVVKISGASLDEYLDEFSDSIGFLSLLGLQTPIIYGWGNSLSQRLDDDKIPYSWHPETGDRITSPEAMNYVKAIAEEYGDKINLALSQRNVISAICDRFLQAVPADWSEYEPHSNGVVVGIKESELKRLIQDGVFPIISPLGKYEGSLLNVNADTAARVTVSKLRPMRYVLLSNPGGILDSSMNIIPRIKLSKDYERLSETGIVTGGMLKKLDEAKKVLEDLNSNGNSHAVQIAHPKNLLSELFTDEGAGTYVEL